MPTIAQEKTADAILVIDATAKNYAKARAVLADRVTEYEREARRLQASYLTGIKFHAAKAADAQALLTRAIEARPDLFVKPRTMTLHGIKLGFQKGKGQIEWDDADKVVARIRKHFGKGHPLLDSFIDTKVTPSKTALLSAEADLLKKLGCTLTGTADTIYLKAADSEIDKIVARMLDEGQGGAK